MVDGGGVYPNLFSTHPPFQLDGNMGLTSGIAEMLLQSHAGVIDLLPALPEAWPNGSVKGLKARNGVEVDISWTNGELNEAYIKTAIPGKYKVKHGGEEKRIETTVAGQEMTWTRS